jgi:hypothetical protein
MGWTDPGALALGLPQQLGQSRDVDGDPSRLVFQHRRVAKPT